MPIVSAYAAHHPRDAGLSVRTRTRDSRSALSSASSYFDDDAPAGLKSIGTNSVR